MSITGFKSNYNDSGYNVPSSGSYYGSDGALLSGGSLIASSDLYANVQQPGVFMINGTKGIFSDKVLPAFCSASNMQNIGLENDRDNAWIVYPGYGFVLYTDANYLGTQSRFYTNNTTNPVLFFTENTFVTAGATRILTTTGANYPNDSTSSIKIYFRFQEITITGLN